MTSDSLYVKVQEKSPPMLVSGKWRMCEEKLLHRNVEELTDMICDRE